MKYLIRVPATSANLGPGFDCLGLALDIWNDLEVSVEGQELSIEINGFGKDNLPTNKNNAIYKAMRIYADYLHRELPSGLKLVCTNRIPLGSGLGSSSAAIVSGILAATAVLGLPANLDEKLDIAAQIEGHPDNVAPCLMGGLTASMIESNQVIAKNLIVSEEFKLVLVYPYFDFPTHMARKVLPQKVAHQDAVFNTGHAIFVTEALRTGDLELLRVAMQDRIHQPFRLPLIPGASQAIEAAAQAGSVVTILSGAGPSLLSFSPSSIQSAKIAEAMTFVFNQNGLNTEVFYPSISQAGASIQILG
jgi:homoserine kinase